MHILLCGSFDEGERDAWLKALQGACPDAHWHLSADPRIEVAVVANPQPGALRGLPRLRLIQSLWAGVDSLLKDASLPPNVPIARMVDPAMSAAMAETALWATLSLHRDFFRYAAQQREGRWQPLPQRRADEVAVAILGLGQMGRRCAGRLAALGYRVTGWNLHGASGLPDVEVCSGDDALQRLLGRSDVVINLLPLTPDTEGLLDERCFSAMRSGAGLVNLARGAHVVDADLLRALEASQVGHAVLDTFHNEPLAAGHPFWTHPQVTLLPHIAAATDLRSAAGVVAANLRALREHQPLAHQVDRARGY